jgi:hypothetical protein
MVLTMSRVRLAATRWIPYSLAGAAISVVVGLVFHLSVARLLVSALLAVALIFGGLAFRSVGKEKEIEFREKDSENRNQEQNP